MFQQYYISIPRTKGDIVKNILRANISQFQLNILALRERIFHTRKRDISFSQKLQKQSKTENLIILNNLRRVYLMKHTGVKYSNNLFAKRVKGKGRVWVGFFSKDGRSFLRTK